MEAGLGGAVLLGRITTDFAMTGAVAPLPASEAEASGAVRPCGAASYKKEALYKTGFMAFPEEYVRRRAELGECFFDLPDGRKICYWTDGSKDSGVPIMCFHGGCEGKSKWIQKQSIPGVFLVAIDRPNYGKSSPVPQTYAFPDVVKDIGLLADALGLDQFVCMGHSVGTCWSQQLAAALPHRVRGIILFASMTDPCDPTADTNLKIAVGYYPMKDCGPCGKWDFCCHPFKGICGCLPRCILTSMTRLTLKSEACKMEMNFKKGGKTGYEKFIQDPFWQASMVDSWCAHEDGKAILGDTRRSLVNKWTYNTADIKCPVFIWQGEGDMDCQVPATTDQLQRLIPHAKIEIVPDFGHICLNGPNEWTVERVKQAVAGMPRLEASTDAAATVGGPERPTTIGEPVTSVPNNT